MSTQAIVSAVETPKFILDYQATDGEGNPIGKPTHLESDTPEEMFEKQKAAHINAVRALDKQNKAFESLKSRQLTPKSQPIKPVELTTDQTIQATADLQNPQKAQDALRKLTGIENLESRLKVAEAKAVAADQKAAAYQFMISHKGDYFPCAANAKVLSDWLETNNYDFTADNLEIAYAQVDDNLAQAPRASSNADNGTSIASPEAIRQPNLGITPGAGSGVRIQRQTGLSRKDVLKLAKENPAEFKRRLRDPKLKADMDAALAKA
jgi:hypothetical protein